MQAAFSIVTLGWEQTVEGKSPATLSHCIEIPKIIGEILPPGLPLQAAHGIDDAKSLVFAL